MGLLLTTFLCFQDEGFQNLLQLILVVFPGIVMIGGEVIQPNRNEQLSGYGLSTLSSLGDLLNNPSEIRQSLQRRFGALLPPRVR
mmetsp:Transcript_8583/g.13265  ORF Transcript_8583/g.13265 Transcript_8583/m.13265 type:complete len:85 (+) Transcript_8583:505-759(+)